MKVNVAHHQDQITYIDTNSSSCVLTIMYKLVVKCNRKFNRKYVSTILYVVM